MNIAVILGTRPEIIKLAPIIKKLNKKNSIIIFSGQHYDHKLSKLFFQELNVRQPDYFLNISKTEPAKQIGESMIKISKIIKDANIDNLIVQGDTNTALAGGLTSIKCQIQLSHIEAGLRSYDWRMPEEHNRIEIDHISDLLFAPTKDNQNILQGEKTHGRVFVTGNTVIDSLKMFSKISKQKSTIDIPNDEFLLMTLHRSENIENKQILKNIIKGISHSKTKIIFPVHPHTLKNLKNFGIYEKIKKLKNIKMIEPVGYFDMIELMKKCSFIVTDSGGIQEESTSPDIKKKVLVLRKTSDRNEAIQSDWSYLVGTSSKNIAKAINATNLNKNIPRSHPYGIGNSSGKILTILKKFYK